MKTKLVESDEPATTGLERLMGAALFVLLLAVVLGVTLVRSGAVTP